MVRFKSRYLLCELCVSEPSSLHLFEDKVVYQALRGAVNRAHGDYGAAIFNIGVLVKYLNAHTGVVLIRCRKAHYRLVWSSLPFITFLENRGQKVRCFFNCLHVGGTIRTSQKFLIKYNRQQLQRMLLHCKTDAEKQDVRKAILSCSVSLVRGEETDGSDDDDDGDEEDT